MRADLLLAENIRALLARRRHTERELARWCGHSGPWLNKILMGERGIRLKDLDKVADFFGLRVDQLFAPGISPLTERRGLDRRSGNDRRQRGERRKHWPPLKPTD